jgi:hypothetical protein
MHCKIRANIKCPFSRLNRPLRRYKKQSKNPFRKKQKKEKKSKMIWKSL